MLGNGLNDGLIVGQIGSQIGKDPTTGLGNQESDAGRKDEESLEHFSDILGNGFGIEGFGEKGFDDF